MMHPVGTHAQLKRSGKMPSDYGRGSRANSFNPELPASAIESEITILLLVLLQIWRAISTIH